MTHRLDLSALSVHVRCNVKFDKNILKYFVKMKRVHPSGASKRKLSQLNKDKAESEAKVNKKVTEFFAKNLKRIILML